MAHSIFSLILNTVASLLAGILLLRFWMQAIRVTPPASLAQFTFLLSDWLVKPLRRLIPGVGGLDWASILGAYLIALASIFIQVGWMPEVSMSAVLLLSGLRMVQWALYGLMGSLIFEVIFSWVNPYAPMAPFVRALNEPLLRPLRRIIPAIGGIDITVLVAFIFLQVALLLVEGLVLPLL